LIIERGVNVARNILREVIGLERAEYTPVGEVTAAQLGGAG